MRLIPFVLAILLFAASGFATVRSEAILPARAVLSAGSAAGHWVFTDSLTLATHARLIEEMRLPGMRDRSMGETVQLLAERLLGTPYVEHMLDRGDREELVVSLAGFDCVLYVEAVVALARVARTGEERIEAFAQNVEALRYRDGRLLDHCSRLHYFSDWLYDNDRRGNVRIVTDELRAARPFRKEINFMTENRRAYRGLASNDAFTCIRDVQGQLNQRSFSYVPQDRIADVYDDLEHGDIVALTSSVAGLDIAHTGFVFKYPDGRTGLIHASTTGQVRQEPDLARYVQGVRGQTGMMVARPTDPRLP
jgi:hypothetical protein